MAIVKSPDIKLQGKCGGFTFVMLGEKNVARKYAKCPRHTTPAAMEHKQVFGKATQIVKSVLTICNKSTFGQQYTKPIPFNSMLSYFAKGKKTVDELLAAGTLFTTQSVNIPFEAELTYQAGIFRHQVNFTNEGQFAGKNYYTWLTNDDYSVFFEGCHGVMGAGRTTQESKILIIPLGLRPPVINRTIALIRSDNYDIPEGQATVIQSALMS